MKKLWVQNLVIITVFLAAFFLVIGLGLAEGKDSRSVQVAGEELREKNNETPIPETPSKETAKEPLQLTENSTVYVTKTGTKYHLWADCSALGQAKTILTATLKDVATEGKQLCSFCNKRQNPQENG